MYTFFVLQMASNKEQWSEVMEDKENANKTQLAPLKKRKASKRKSSAKETGNELGIETEDLLKTKLGLENDKIFLQAEIQGLKEENEKLTAEKQGLEREKNIWTSSEAKLKQEIKEKEENISGLK